MRTQEEILAKIKEVESADFMGTKTGDLVQALTFENAKSYLKEGVTEDQWKPLASDKQVITEMRDYMPFAWEKANGKRGLSAARTMHHYGTWLWLIGQDGLAAETENYRFYGKPQLERICRFLDLDPAKFDDGVRENS